MLFLLDGSSTTMAPSSITGRGQFLQRVTESWLEEIATSSGGLPLVGHFL
jgi:hypothetical protein